MSRVGKKIISIPEGVTVTLDKATVFVKGPKGELSQEVFDGYTVQIDGSTVSVVADGEDKSYFPKWGLLTRLIENMVTGTSVGFSKQLVVDGVGYKSAVKGDVLTINAGFSHPFMYKAPEGVAFQVEGNTVTVSGYDKQVVGQVAAEIRAIRPPEPYKGKGIRYADEHIIRKEGKTSA
ncbi:50S ribosomal protein L6 [Chitinivibrio alkaliphilus]|uniref:Large ribosomal subunit protein uL6 n=1 Tax=Chitinivibrio alkaliphilus ACht1 TaxID=1313304 RepID=U7D5Q3_9BACT|nr:50S ribosomal protein L6 [Chitinivibrio alkaliphilus]ERP31303.1 50S ribosomal protein L6 [Chitinivibrio alkaliphilus ACht1]